MFSSEPGLDMLFAYMSKVLNKTIKGYTNRTGKQDSDFVTFI